MVSERRERAALLLVHYLSQTQVLSPAEEREISLIIDHIVEAALEECVKATLEEYNAERERYARTLPGWDEATRESREKMAQDKRRLDDEGE